MNAWIRLINIQDPISGELFVDKAFNGLAGKEVSVRVLDGDPVKRLVHDSRIQEGWVEVLIDLPLT